MASDQWLLAVMSDGGASDRLLTMISVVAVSLKMSRVGYWDGFLAVVLDGGIRECFRHMLSASGL